MHLRQGPRSGGTAFNFFHHHVGSAPGVFRLPLAQVGARLATSRVLLVPQSVVLPQLTEGAVHVTWDAVADQFPADVLAVPAAEVTQRIANGSLVLPLDEIMGQLPPDLFAAFMMRGPLEVPGIEGFPAPFKPIGHEEPAATVAAPPPAVVESPAPVATPVSAPPVAPGVIQERPSPRPETSPAAGATPRPGFERRRRNRTARRSPFDRRSP